MEGDEGTAFVDGEGSLRIVRDGPDGRSEDIPSMNRSDAYASSYGATIAHFVHGLRTGAPFETDFRDNLRTLAITLAAYDSIETGQPVDLQPLLSAL